MSKIAILSDIHFGKFSRTSSFTVPGEESQDKSKEAHPLEEGLIELLKTIQPEYIFVAGDLTSLGNPQEFYFCENKILEIAQRIGVNHDNIFCVLGNHDIDWNITKLGTVGKNINEEVNNIIKSKYQKIAANSAKIIMDRLGKNCISNGIAPFSGVVEKGDFVGFFLNTGWYCTHDQQFLHGKLANEQLEWFEKVTSQYKDDERIKILLMHHHPVNYSYPIPSIDISAIEEGPEIMDIAFRNGIDIIIHGHRHHPHIETVKTRNASKPITIICAGSLSVNSEHRNHGEIPNTVHILDIDKNRKYQIVYNYKYTDADGWMPIDKNCKVTPIDAIMKVGKIFDQDEIRVAIEEYRKDERRKLCKDDLAECLQFMSNNDLNNWCMKILKPTHDIVGAFPDQVVLLEKKGR